MQKFTLPSDIMYLNPGAALHRDRKRQVLLLFLSPPPLFEKLCLKQCGLCDVRGPSLLRLVSVGSAVNSVFRIMKPRVRREESKGPARTEGIRQDI